VDAVALAALSGGIGLLLGLALLYGFLNGFNDSASIVATLVSSGTMAPRQALLLAALAELAGPFLFGSAVAATLGAGLIRPASLLPLVLGVALVVAIGWGIGAWGLGLPTSSSHALVGALVGAVIGAAGWSAVQPAGLLKVGLALLLAPVLGFLSGWLVMRLMLNIARHFTPRVNVVFKRGQVLTAVVLALSHGTNDAQKTMALIGLLLLIEGLTTEFTVPLWAVAAAASALALGFALGGYRIIRTLGVQIYRIRPIHGFCAQGSAAIVVLGAALLGGPVSTTQVIGAAIIGVGSAERLSKVRWPVARTIALAWVVTLPATALLAAGLARLLLLLLPF